MGGVRTSIIGRPRPLPHQRHTHPATPSIVKSQIPHYHERSHRDSLSHSRVVGMAREHPTDKAIAASRPGDAPRNLGCVCLRHVVAAVGTGRHRGIREVITVGMALASGMVVHTC